MATCGLEIGGKGVGEYVQSEAGERYSVPIGRASMTVEQFVSHSANSIIMLPAFWFCMLAVYLYLRSVNILGVCNSTSTVCLEGEAVELTDVGFAEVPTSSIQPHLSGSREIAARG